MRTSFSHPVHFSPTANLGLRLALAVFCLAGFLRTRPTRAAEATLPCPIPPPAEIIGKLDPGHPRLLATKPDFDRLRSSVKENPVLKEWQARIAARAERTLGDQPSRYEIPDGLRLLATSRRVLDRVFTLGLLYQLEGDPRYTERAWKELEAAAAFKDWNPRHFLDTAEMSCAFGIGYDWFYQAWTPEQRSLLKNALIEKGLKLAQDSYRGAPTHGWWVKARHNWNQVCNGGIAVGALAIADEEPALAGEIIHEASKSLQLPMAEFAPDGAWNEGPGYWNYATSYNVFALAALASALGTDFNLSALPAFSDTGLFPIYLTGPLRRTFNYADGGDGTIRAAQMFWLARRFNRPEYARYQEAIASPHPLDLLWYDPGLETAAQGPSPLPLDKYFRGVEVAVFRSEWDNRDAVFIGFKAGDNKANHSNLDLGTFVLDALGVRWAVDLGADNYNLPGYFGGKRWTYYRMRAEGHNTLVINPDKEPDQDPKAAARILRFKSVQTRASAVADLTPAYARNATKVLRGIALLNRSQVLVQDEVEASKPAEVWWFLHTPAQVEVAQDGASAILTQGAKQLHARLLSPSQARFSVMSATLAKSPHAEGQANNENVRKLAVHLSDVKDTRLAVLLMPIPAGATAPDLKAQDLLALDKW